MSDDGIGGKILLDYSKELREELKDAGTTNCYTALETIKLLKGVEDAWFPKQAGADIIIQVQVLITADGHKLKEQISLMDGITNVRLSLGIPG